jgi:hypothetical protein
VKKHALSQKQLDKATLRLQTLTAQLAALGPMMRGTIVTNGKRHPQPYFSLNKDHRTHLIYLGERRLPIAKELAKNYAKAIEIIEEMTVVNMALLKNDAVVL